MRQRLVLAALLYVAAAMVGAFVAVTQKVPYQFGGQGDPNTVWRDFVQGSGTAMSPPLGALVIFFLAALLASRRGWLGKIGVAVLVLLGLIFLAGTLGEPLTFNSLNPANPDPWKAMVQWIEVVMAVFVVVYGLGALFGKEGKEETGGRGDGGSG